MNFLEYSELFLNIYGKVKIFIILCAVYSYFANINYYKLKIAKKLFNLKFKIDLIHLNNPYNLSKYLTFNQIKRINKYMSLDKIVKA